MESTAHFHHEVAHPFFNETNDFFHHPASFDAAIDVLDAHSTLGDQAIGGFLLDRELFASRLLGGHEGGHSIEGESLEAQILQELTARRQRIGRAIGNFLIMPLSLNRLAQKENFQGLVDQQHVFHRVFLFLAAVIELLIIRVLGARDTSLGAIVTKRGVSVGSELCSEVS
jgi:hypothetical protein